VASQEKFMLECVDCDGKFIRSRPDKNGVFICPFCGSYDVDVLDDIKPPKDFDRLYKVMERR